MRRENKNKLNERLIMDRYTKVAKIKISKLLKEESFVRLTYIGEYSIDLEISDKIYTVNNFGNTTWENKTK